MIESIIETENVEFQYVSHIEDSSDIKALSDISIEVEKGQFVVILGRNGSGKSTFARLLNALLLPSKGAVYIKGADTRDERYLWEIRRAMGIIFQNPDNQIIGTTVEEDVAFGAENLGVDPEEIRKRVDASLEAVGIREYSTHAPHLLSGGQKQRVAIAGILAMKPDCIILDEATAMLDPVGRKEVMQVIKELNAKEKITVIHITHHMDEAEGADRIIIFDEGKAVLDGRPKEVFSNVGRIKELGLEVPMVTELLYELNKNGFDFPLDVLNVEDAFGCLSRKIEKDKGRE